MNSQTQTATISPVDGNNSSGDKVVPFPTQQAQTVRGPTLTNGQQRRNSDWTIRLSYLRQIREIAKEYRDKIKSNWGIAPQFRDQLLAQIDVTVEQEARKVVEEFQTGKDRQDWPARQALWHSSNNYLSSLRQRVLEHLAVMEKTEEPAEVKKVTLDLLCNAMFLEAKRVFSEFLDLAK